MFQCRSRMLAFFALAFQLKLKVNRIFHSNALKKGVLFIVTVFFVVGFCSVNTFVYDDTKISTRQSHCHTKRIASSNIERKKCDRTNSMQWKSRQIFPCFNNMKENFVYETSQTRSGISQRCISVRFHYFLFNGLIIIEHFCIESID